MSYSLRLWAYFLGADPRTVQTLFFFCQSGLITNQFYTGRSGQTTASVKPPWLSRTHYSLRLRAFVGTDPRTVQTLFFFFINPDILLFNLLFVFFITNCLRLRADMGAATQWPCKHHIIIVFFLYQIFRLSLRLRADMGAETQWPCKHHIESVCPCVWRVEIFPICQWADTHLTPSTHGSNLWFYFIPRL